MRWNLELIFSGVKICRDKISSCECSLLEILLGIFLVVIRAWNKVATHTWGNYSRHQNRLVTRPIRCFLGHNQFPVSTQHHVRARGRACVYPDIRSPESRILCRSCVSATRVSRIPFYFPCVFRCGIIASVRYTKLLLRDLDPPLKYISLISLVAPWHDLGSLAGNWMSSKVMRNTKSRTSVHKSLSRTFMSIFYDAFLLFIN